MTEKHEIVPIEPVQDSLLKALIFGFYVYISKSIPKWNAFFVR